MSLSVDLQIKELLDKSQSVLIIVPQNPSGDSFGAAAGLGAFLEQTGKLVTLAGDGIGDISKRFDFLDPPENITSSVSGVREFILSFSTKHNDIVSVRTERGADEYNIYITPEKGSIDPRDFSFVPAKFSFDLVFVIGAPDKDTLGKISGNNPDIFYEVPVISIDHHADNERFGQINIVDITASTTSEIVTILIEKLGRSKMGGRVASLLLGGIVSGTESFQEKTTTPGALHTASRLMDYGANQHDIIFRLVKMQPLPLLRLWGRVMSNLKWDESRGLMWAQVSPEDIERLGTQPYDLSSILEKIRNHASIGLVFAILLGDQSSAKAFFKCHNKDDLTRLAELFPESIVKRDIIEWSVPKTPLDELESIFISTIPKIEKIQANVSQKNSDDVRR